MDIDMISIVIVYSFDLLLLHVIKYEHMNIRLAVSDSMHFMVQAFAPVSHYGRAILHSQMLNMAAWWHTYLPNIIPKQLFPFISHLF